MSDYTNRAEMSSAEMQELKRQLEHARVAKEAAQEELKNVGFANLAVCLL